MKRHRISNKMIVDVYSKKGANMTATASALGISRRTLERWRNTDERLDSQMADTEESLVDFAETKLMEAISDGNITGIIFFLKTKGKSRGYVESYENNVSVNSFERLIKELPDDAYGDGAEDG